MQLHSLVNSVVDSLLRLVPMHHLDLTDGVSEKEKGHGTVS